MKSLGGNQKRRIGIYLFVISLCAAGIGVAYAPSALAWDREAFHQRMAERRAEREARRLERQQENELPEVSVPEQESGDQPCSCRARVKFKGMGLQWRDNSLLFTPRIDASIRVDGDSSDSDWNLNFAYAGKIFSERGTVSFPSDKTFDGSKSWGGACHDGRHNLRGIALEPISITDMARSLFGEDDDLRGRLRLHGVVSGCDSDEFEDDARFRIKKFGNIDV